MNMVDILGFGGDAWVWTGGVVELQRGCGGSGGALLVGRIDPEMRNQSLELAEKLPGKLFTGGPRRSIGAWWLAEEMDEPNITMEEYIRLEEEKAHMRGKVYNWETATYGKIWCDEDVHGRNTAKTEFPAIVFNDVLKYEVALSCEPMVSLLNDNQIYFRISLDEFDDEDYTVIYDKNSFSYKIIYVNDLKTDSENDNDKVNMPSFLSSEPTVIYFDDFDYFKDFEKEFPAIAYNDALTSKLDFFEPTISPQHIDEFDKTSLSEYDGDEQNVTYFNDLFSFNVIYLDDLSDKDNDNDKIDIEQSSGDLLIEPLPTDTYLILLSFTHCGNKSILRVLRIILVILPEHPSETIVFHNEDGNPARANIKQALGYRKDGDGNGNFQTHKGVKASANSDVKYSFTSAQDGEPLQDDVRLCLGNDLKKAQDHSQRHV
ncbi:hypothetical protein Tco_1556089 [Tanacetum coccineum]